MEPWETQVEVPVAAELAVVAAPVAKVKKLKVMRAINRRKMSAKKAAKFGVSPVQSSKLIWEHPQLPYFMVQFPEENKADIIAQLNEIPSATVYNSTAIDLTGCNNFSPDNTQVIWVQRWRIHKSDENLQIVTIFGKKNKFDFDGDILIRAALAGADGKRLLVMSSAKSNSTVKLPVLGKNKFRPFQKAGIAYALEAKRTFIADEMGLGKTIQALGTAAAVGDWPIVVICPNTLKLNWQDEATKWLGKKHKVVVLRNRDLQPLNARVPKGEDPASVPPLMSPTMKKKVIKKSVAWLRTHSVIIVNYDKLKKWAEYLVALNPNFVVFDESHYVKGNSHRSRICKQMMEDIKPEYILMLTGTPVMSRPVELIRQLQIMDRMKEFGGVQHFMNRYCNIVNVDMSALPPLPKPNEDGTMPELDADQKLGLEMRDALVRKVYENQMELNHRLRSVCYVRREKSDVLTDLPDKVRSTLTFEISNRDEYESIAADVSAYLGERAAKDEKFLKSIKKLSPEMKIKAIKEQRSTAEYKSSRAEALVRIEMLKQAAAIGKLGSVKEWIEDFHEQNPKEKLVVFATHNRILDELEAMFKGQCVTVRGRDNDVARHKAVTAFQDKNNKKAWLLFGSLKAAGVGITLTAASNVAFIELGWTPALHDQAEDRCHRIGQKNNVTAYYLLAEDTIEVKIAKLIESKRQVVDAVSFGDPLEKMLQTGSILGDLVASLIGKKTTL